MRAARMGFAASSLLCAVPMGAWAQTASTANTIPLGDRAEGGRVEELRIRTRRSGGNAVRDGAVEGAVRASLSGIVGQPFSRVDLERRLAAPRTRIGPGGISWRLLEEVPGHGFVLLVEIDTAVGESVAGDATGLLSAQGAGFPVLHRDERSMMTAVMGGGFGLYSDSNPWFGQPLLFNRRNPLAGHLPGARASWTEGYLEYGVAGATQIGRLPLYLYGMLTGFTTWSLGQDVFRDDPRSVTGIERAYAGLLYVDADSGNAANLSLGRQTFTLNDGFLVNLVKGSANAGARGATYLGPRLANDFSALLALRLGDWTLRAFYIEPNEMRLVQTNSTYLGMNLRRQVTATFSLDATYISVPRSDSNYANPYGMVLPREGLNTVSAHALWRQPLGVPGLWAEAELAHQWHDRFAMSAWAGYALLGFRAADLPWRPSLSYRYAAFTGDDPNTTRYERFDALLSTGLGIWLQGLNFGKVTANSNLQTHRVQFNLAPREGLNFTLDWHRLRAPELYNAGGNPALARLRSHDIGQEFTLSARWSISRQVYLQSFISTAIPGRALREVGADRPWTTVQASLYWNL